MLPYLLIEVCNCFQTDVNAVNVLQSTYHSREDKNSNRVFPGISDGLGAVSGLQMVVAV